MPFSLEVMNGFYPEIFDVRSDGKFKRNKNPPSCLHICVLPCYQVGFCTEVLLCLDAFGMTQDYR